MGVNSPGGLRRGGAGALQGRLAASSISPFGACHLSHIASHMRLGLLRILQVLLDHQHQLEISSKILIEVFFLSISYNPTLHPSPLVPTPIQPTLPYSLHPLPPGLSCLSSLSLAHVATDRVLYVVSRHLPRLLSLDLASSRVTDRQE